MIPLNSSEIQHIATATAEEAVRKTLLAMGVDVSKPEALLEMQLDFAHMRRWRKSVETVRNQSIISAVIILITGFAGAVWLAVTMKGGH